MKDYLLATIKHKWYVLLACQRVGDIPLWRAIIHDWSKFTPAELPHYQRQFFGDKSDPEGFAKAWLHHIHRNPHHWNHWVVCGDYWTKEARKKNIFNNALPMPPIYVREMVADWLGASRAYTGSWDMTDWLSKNLAQIQIHPHTKFRVTQVLKEMGYDADQIKQWFEASPQEDSG